MQTSEKPYSRFGIYVLFQIAILSGLSQQVFGQTASYPDFYAISKTPTMNSFNLLKWDRAGKPLPNPVEPYDREKHFGGWIDDGRDQNCLNTRAKILVRGSQVPVTYMDQQKCIVATGQWLDLYTNQTVRNAADLQIDHFVPLKQAYITGAWAWNRKQRCLYGNYLFNDFQLLAVSSAQNQSKSDHAPDEYMPPNKALWCPYLANWLKIKFIWNLVMTPPEAQAIAQLFTSSRCNAKDFQFTVAELQKQRSMISANAMYCDYDVGHKP